MGYVKRITSKTKRKQHPRYKASLSMEASKRETAVKTSDHRKIANTGSLRIGSPWYLHLDPITAKVWLRFNNGSLRLTGDRRKLDRTIGWKDRETGEFRTNLPGETFKIIAISLYISESDPVKALEKFINSCHKVCSQSKVIRHIKRG